MCFMLKQTKKNKSYQEATLRKGKTEDSIDKLKGKYVALEVDGPEERSSL